MARSISSSVNCSPGSSQIWLPPMWYACSLTGTRVSRVSFPPWMASKVRSRVISLVMDAMGTRSSGFFS